MKLIGMNGFDCNDRLSLLRRCSVTGRTPIMQAVVRANAKLVSEMLEAYAEEKVVTEKSKEERITSTSVLKKNFKVMKLNHTDNNGETVFHIAARHS
jgi:hypothetical protein